MSALAADKRELLAFLHEAGALQFGEFTLKSGRVSPYFFNSGRFCTGAQLQRLGEFYAAAIERCAPDTEIVFGPAYKGIPLCISAAMALGRRRGREVGYLFDRKEAKSHGDAGRFVGKMPGPEDRLVLVDDVLTDGATKREAVRELREVFQAPIEALVIAFNRMETDARGEDAQRRFRQATGIPVVSLLSLAELEQALADGEAGGVPAVPPHTLEKIREYRERYGAKE